MNKEEITFFKNFEELRNKNLIELLKISNLTIADLKKVYNFEIKKGWLKKSIKFNTDYLRFALSSFLLSDGCRQEYLKII